ncbi:MAG: hypothetical protein CMM87_03050 [Rickettsiales bacterium]|nr:hypothetical protein [Rickettsiales bacterium]|tara:strand:+ start:707 stop:1555 length:849 start_codon:yes stop_codon:yes gene_type:complete
MKNLKYFFIFYAMLVSAVNADPAINLDFSDNLFVKIRVPERGIVCSNIDRVLRLKDLLKDVVHHKTSWGTNVFIGTYQGVPMFLVNAPVGSGAGLVFTELYSAGAQAIVRFGSDDVKSPPLQEFSMVKLVSESDNLVGYRQASGEAPEKWGTRIPASQKLYKAFKESAEKKGLLHEDRICHHLENYHALRNPNIFSGQRRARLQKNLAELKQNSGNKKESFDMETAVLYQVAQDFDRHGLTILQTVDKESLAGPYAGENRAKALAVEKKIAEYAFATLAAMR